MESLSSVFNFVEVILFGIHSPDYLFTADKYIHEATRPCSAIMVLQRKKKKKKNCACEARTPDLDVISTQCQKKREVLLVRLELTTFKL